MLNCILSIYVLYEFKCNGIAAQSRAKSSCVSDQNMSTAGTGIKSPVHFDQCVYMRKRKTNPT